MNQMHLHATDVVLQNNVQTIESIPQSTYTRAHARARCKQGIVPIVIDVHFRAISAVANCFTDHTRVGGYMNIEYLCS